MMKPFMETPEHPAKYLRERYLLIYHRDIAVDWWYGCDVSVCTHEITFPVEFIRRYMIIKKTRFKTFL